MSFRGIMPRVRVIHWREAEAGPLVEACRSAGFDVDYLERDGGAVIRAIRAKLPDAIAIDLSRLPSHGREVAVFLRGSKVTRSIPIVFVGGDAVKVAGIRELLPDAAYCEVDKVADAVRRLAKPGPKAEPVVPPGIMERGREKPAAEKLGIAAGVAVCVVDAPREFPGLLGVVPGGVEFGEEEAPITLWFVHDLAGLFDSLRRMRTIAAKTKLWLLWRKGATGNALTQNVLRETVREVGLVDYKICSVDARWSGMLFARKKA